MSVNITYFVHGTTVDNENKISSGWSDPTLSSLGIKQSKELTKQTDNIKFDAVFTSDLSRAIDSADITWGDKYPTFQDRRLRECNYGKLNGRPSREVEPLQDKSITKPMPGGESYEMIKTRVANFLDDVRKEYDNKHIAIVAHKAPQLALDVLLRGKTWQQAFADDWRKNGAWQPGWSYTLE